MIFSKAGTSFCLSYSEIKELVYNENLSLNTKTLYFYFSATQILMIVFVVLFINNYILHKNRVGGSELSRHTIYFSHFILTQNLHGTHGNLSTTRAFVNHHL